MSRMPNILITSTLLPDSLPDGILTDALAALMQVSEESLLARINSMLTSLTKETRTALEQLNLYPIQEDGETVGYYMSIGGLYLLLNFEEGLREVESRKEKVTRTRKALAAARHAETAAFARTLS